jgi:hypothetical protein
MYEYEHGSLSCRYLYVDGKVAAYKGQKIYLMRDSTCMCQHPLLGVTNVPVNKYVLGITYDHIRSTYQ